MENTSDKLNQLLAKIELLSEKQKHFSEEILGLYKEVHEIKQLNQIDNLFEEKQEIAETPLVSEKPKSIIEAVVTPRQQEITNTPQKNQVTPSKPIRVKKTKSDLEKFIGENLINKIGIIITVIGVAIGVKYSIENDLISPLTRIILGYFAGLTLLGLALKLKKKYLNYSAVLVSGAMAILYFITFAAYSFYDLFPQLIAFGLMFVFTIFTVIAALNYNKQIIAHLGLVGAYAVPFLLSDNSGKVIILFSYMAIINIGILVIAFKKYWKPLYYSAFLFTWLIFTSWYIFDYDMEQHYTIALVFLTLFFLIFYAIFLSYKLIKKEEYTKSDIVLLLVNSFIFYGLGYFILDNHETGAQLLGVFTLVNAIIHFVVSAFIYKQKLASKNLLYLISGLVLLFITIAIPVQLDGNWVTLLWAGEAALLFWIGRSKGIAVYEKLSYPLMVLAVFSIVQDWNSAYDYSYYQYTQIKDFDGRISPIFNIHFLSSLLFVGAFAFISWLARKNQETTLTNKKWLAKVFKIFIPIIFIGSLFLSIFLEISNYFNLSSIDSGIASSDYNSSFNTFNLSIKKLKIIWLLIYTFIFLSILTLFNLKKIKNYTLGYVSLGLNVFTTFLFLTMGLFVLSELRENYLDPIHTDLYKTTSYHLWIRYVSFLFLGILLYASYTFIKKQIPNKIVRKLFFIGLHITAIWVASSELIHWLDLADSNQSYKLGLSIFWGVYSLFLISFGIWKNKQYLRILGFILFAITLLKLFFYDISHLSTISKTIVFVSLGVLLLIISFLYNKYRNKITDENND